MSTVGSYLDLVEDKTKITPGYSRILYKMHRSLPVTHLAGTENIALMGFKQQQFNLLER